MFLPTKYTTWYFSIVVNASLQERTKHNGTYERHHIVPKSLGGTNESDNLVFLTPREHFICHLLLTKMVEGENKKKMCWALHRMTFSRPMLYARGYDLARKLHIRNLKENHPARIDPEAFKEEMSRRVRKSYEDNPELKIIRGETFKKAWRDTPEREKHVEQCRTNAKKGGQAAALKLTGTKRPNLSKPGAKNPATKIMEILDTKTGIMYTADCLKTFSAEHNLSYDCMLQVSRGMNKQHKGFVVVSKRKKDIYENSIDC